eukprot:s7_g6.t1
MPLTCFSALQCLVSKLTELKAERAVAPDVTTGKNERRAQWNEAQKLAQRILREWMQKHPGEPVPEEVFQQCQQEIESSISIDTTHSLQSFVRYAHVDLMRVEGPPQKIRCEEEWQSLFPRYPTLENGFMHCFDSSDSEGMRGALQKYGFCVVKVLTKDECEQSVQAMFEEINRLRIQKDLEGPLIDVEDHSTWQDKNWPSNCKFLVDSVALHPQAFANRCSKKIYETFSGIFQELRLHVSVDKWGVARGAKDRPRWRIGLRPHWDLNPWQCLRDFESGNHPGYQGMVALRDQDLETGCHLTLPGCTHFLKQWSLERKLEKVSKTMKSFRASQEDPLLRYMQPVPLQQGEMVIWSCAQLHGSSHNHSNKMRLSQYIRMFPAQDLDQDLSDFLQFPQWFHENRRTSKIRFAGWSINYDERDTFSCTRVLPRVMRKGELPQEALEGLDELGRCLLGLEQPYGLNTPSTWAGSWFKSKSASVHTATNTEVAVVVMAREAQTFWGKNSSLHIRPGTNAMLVYPHLGAKL